MLTVALGAFSLGVSANENIGADGASVSWTFDENLGILRIDGAGATKDYSKSSTTGITTAPWKAHAEEIKIVSIADTVTGIGKYSFAGCKNLETVVFPSGVTEIKEGVFYGCASLTEFKLPEGTLKIGENAFYGCASVSEMNIPASVDSIGAAAFGGCGGLKTITVAESNAKYHSENNCIIETSTKTLVRGSLDGVIPETVKAIASGAFSGCGFKTVVVPDTIVYMGYGAFSDCTALESVTMPFVGDCRLDKNGEPTVWDETEDKERGKYLNCLWYMFGDNGVPSSLKTVVLTDTEAIGAEAFAGCTQLTSVVLPDKLVKIADGAFYGCAKLAGIELPASLETLGMAAFGGCREFTAIVIPDSVKALGSSLFLGCNKLKSVTVGASVESLGNGFLAGCAALETLSVANGNPNYYSESNCIIAKQGYILVVGCKNSIIPTNIKVIGEGAFRNCIALGEIKIPAGVTKIGDYAFYSCTGLSKIDIPESVKEIGRYAFADCRSLTGMKISKDVKVGESAFENCVLLRVDSLYVSSDKLQNEGGVSVIWIGLSVAALVLIVGVTVGVVTVKKKAKEK